MAGDERTTAVLLFAHGSSVDEANRGVHVLARQVQALGPFAFVRAAFLEQAQPDLATAIAQAVAAGHLRIIILPYFLTLGIHLRRDLPKLIEMEKARNPRMEIEVGQSLEGHPLMPSIILGRAQETLAELKAAR